MTHRGRAATSASLALLALLAGPLPARAQDEVARARAGAKTFREAVAAGLQAGTLQKRLLQRRIYFSEPSGEAQLTRVRGETTATGFALHVEFEQLTKEVAKERVSSHALLFSATGRLVESRYREVSEGQARSGVTRYPPKGKSEATHRVAGKALTPKPLLRSYDPDSYPLYALLFLAPLVEEHLPQALHLATGGSLSPVPYIHADVVGRLEVARSGARASELRYRLGGEEWRVVLSDPRQIRCAPVGGGVGRSRMVEIRPADADALRAQRPVLVREARAARLLMSLNGPQGEHLRQRGRYASDLAQLGLSKELRETPGYRVTLRVSSDGGAWIALAEPVQPGKSGRSCFLIASEAFLLYRTKTPPKLSPDCRIPQSAEPLP